MRFGRPAYSLAVRLALLAGVLATGRALPRLWTRPAPTAREAASLQTRAAQALAEGRPAEALSLCERLLAAFPDNPSYLKLRARALHGLARFSQEALAWELYASSAPSASDACPDWEKAARSAGDAAQQRRARLFCRGIKKRDG